MTRQQDSSSAAFFILTVSPGEEWTAGINGRSRNDIRKKQQQKDENAVSVHQPHRSPEGPQVAEGREMYTTMDHVTISSQIHLII